MLFYHVMLFMAHFLLVFFLIRFINFTTRFNYGPPIIYIIIPLKIDNYYVDYVCYIVYTQYHDCHFINKNVVQDTIIIIMYLK